MILADCMGDARHFCHGLDIGCGTGQSSLALADFCKQVTGIDPSEEMIRKAMTHPAISYLPYDGRQFAFPAYTFDSITFAGSLIYAKSQALLDELIRISRPGVVILVYDFEVQLQPLLSALAIQGSPVENHYDHAVDFSGLSTDNLQLVFKKDGVLSLSAGHVQVAHFLMSHPHVCHALTIKRRPDDLWTQLLNRLQKEFSGKILLSVNTYLTKYARL
ncbi:MAG: class I SAM-dependent methyltransferase [Cyclobacteriaceae bacterium]